MKKLSLLSGLILAISASLSAQNVPVKLSNWKNGAKGAYSIIHDDYGNGGVDGIWQYADTIASNRNLKFTFGAISGDCENFRNINGQPSPYAYAKNVMIPLHGHEIINHTHTHNCAVNRGWSPCDGTGWGQVKNSANWQTELYTSHNSIKTNTGYQPRYFIYPYDQFTDLANTELEALGYIGSRTGWSVDGVHADFYKFGYEANDENLFKPNSTGFFRTSVQVFDDVDAAKSNADQTLELNNPVDEAILNSSWANRELHNVGSSGWGHVEVPAYRAHLNYVKSKVTSGDLWMGTVSEIITYQIQKLSYVPTATADVINKRILVSFADDKSVVNVNMNNYLTPLAVKTSVTVEIDISNYTSLIDFGKIYIMQGSKSITDFKIKNNKLYVNVYPHEGSFIIYPDINIGIEKDGITNLSIFPNPATEVVNIESDIDITDVKIFDLVGNLKLTGNSKQISISSLESGVYFIKINNINHHFKFIKL